MASSVHVVRSKRSHIGRRGHQSVEALRLERRLGLSFVLASTYRASRPLRHIFCFPPPALAHCGGRRALSSRPATALSP